MGLSLMTCIQIANTDNLECFGSGPDSDGKYQGVITLGPDKNCRLLVSSDFRYDSADTAKTEMEKLVAEVTKDIKARGL